MRGKVGDGGLGARQDHEVASTGSGVAGLHHDEVDVRFELQRIEVVEIG